MIELDDLNEETDLLYELLTDNLYLDNGKTNDRYR